MELVGETWWDCSHDDTLVPIHSLYVQNWMKWTSNPIFHDQQHVFNHNMSLYHLIYIISTQSSDCWYNFKRLKMINVFFLSYLSWMIQSFPISLGLRWLRVSQEKLVASIPMAERPPSSDVACYRPSGKVTCDIDVSVPTGRGAWNGLETAGFLSWWFQTCFIFHNRWDNPSHWLIFFKMVKNHQPGKNCMKKLSWLGNWRSMIVLCRLSFERKLPRFPTSFVG